MASSLVIADREFKSRLMLGTGKYRNVNQAIDSIHDSECELVTVAIRRLPTDLNNDNTTFLKSLDWKKLWLLPNTAGSKTAEDAIRMALLGREFAKQIGQEDITNTIAINITNASKISVFATSGQKCIRSFGPREINVTFNRQ